jgi:hypothetical protein
VRRNSGEKERQYKTKREKEDDKYRRCAAIPNFRSSSFSFERISI